jgi:hypothetical protein
MTGDPTDIFTRLKSYLPPWFGGAPTPVLDSLIGGLAWALSQLYNFYAYAKLQTRILTATGFWLDLVAQDYFGPWIVRNPGQADAAFRAYIIANLFRAHATRPSMVSLLEEITGQTPIIFEPWRPADTGAYGAPLSLGYAGVARAGSIAVPYACMIQAFRPQSQGALAGSAFANAPTWSGYHQPLAHGYADSLTIGAVSVDDADVERAIDFNKVAGTVPWTALTSGQYAAPDPYAEAPTFDGSVLDFSDPDESGLIGH